MSTTSALRMALSPRLSVRATINRLVVLDAQYRARRQIRSLDDRLLRDAGMTRADRDAELRRTPGW